MSIVARSSGRWSLHILDSRPPAGVVASYPLRHSMVADCLDAGSSLLMAIVCSVPGQQTTSTNHQWQMHQSLKKRSSIEHRPGHRLEILVCLSWINQVCCLACRWFAWKSFESITAIVDHFRQISILSAIKFINSAPFESFHNQFRVSCVLDLELLVDLMVVWCPSKFHLSYYLQLPVLVSC